MAAWEHQRDSIGCMPTKYRKRLTLVHVAEVKKKLFQASKLSNVPPIDNARMSATYQLAPGNRFCAISIIFGEVSMPATLHKLNIIA